MKSVCNRIGCLFLTLVLFATCGVLTAIPAKAAYENTYVNTGDQRADLIGVALTQVGYREGSNNYTKYGVWFGQSNMAWCGAFVSWCANQAGIPTSVLRKNGFASASSFGIPSYTVNDRIPRPGDLFFKNNGAHVGIVYYVEGDYFYTLEGNTYEGNGAEGVYCRKRNLYGAYYFGAPNYQSDSSHSYVRGVENAHPHKEYYKCSDCGSQYYTGKTVTSDSCIECKMANCSHKYGSYTKVDGTSHKTVCSLCTKELNSRHQWVDSKVIKEATCKAKGTKEQKCSQCTATRQADIPKTEDHQYEQWEYIDEEKHSAVCKTCSHQQELEHTVTLWETSNLDHWRTCDDCGGRADIGAHTFQDGCESACTVCEYVNPTGHTFATIQSYDANNHWIACLTCGKKQQLQAHEFGAACGENCEICGYTRQTEHTFAQSLSSNAKGHWYACTVCGKAQEIHAHTPGPEATEQTGQCCTTCNYEIIPAAEHAHTYEPYSHDLLSHWGSCQCGHTQKPEAHIWDLALGTCSVCGAEPAVPEKEPFPWLIVLPCVGGGFLLIAIIIAVAVAKKRKKAKKKTPVGVS